MKRTKKVLTLLLCMLMLVGILPLGQRARAEEITNLSAAITLPTAGAHPVFTGTPGDSTLYTVREVKFYDGDYALTDADTFTEGKTYRILVWFRPVYSGYEIPAGGTAVINGSYTAEYHSAVSDGYGTKIFKLFYKVPAPENTGTKLNKVTVSDIQVPVIWDNLDSSFSVAPEAAYKKESIYQTIRWSKKSGSYTYISCAEGEMVKAGEIYCATILLRSKDDRPFDGNHPITITANTLHGTDAVYHKVVDTQYTLRNDNMVIEIKLFFKACMVYDYTFCFTNAPGKTHGMPKHGERVWDYYDVVPITQESDINTGSLSWYKSGTTTYLYPQETFQTGQEYELYFYLVDGETAIIKPGTIIVYYDDATGLYFEGELVADTYNGECHAWMEPKFTPVDPVIHSVELVNFSPPEIDDTVGQHVTVWANTSAGYELVSQTWHNQQGNTLPNSSIFEAATSYYSQLTVRPLNDRSFDSNIDVTLKNHNGSTVAIDDIQLQSDGTLRIRTASFPLVGYADTVRIYDYVPPTVGRLAGWCYPKINNSAYEFNQLTWHNATDNVTMSDSDVFEAGKTYYLMFTVKAKPGYTLDSDTQVRITTQYSGNTVETHAPAYSSGVLICSTKSTVAKERITDRVKVHGYRDPVAGEISLDVDKTLSVPEGCGYRIGYAGWVYTDYTRLSEYTKLQTGRQYGLLVVLQPIDGYYFNVPRSLSSLELCDTSGKIITTSMVQWDGAGIYAFDYMNLTGTECLFFYTKWATAAEPIDYVQFDIDEPVVGEIPDYTPAYPAGAHYYSANDIYMEDPEYNTEYHNDVMWDYLPYGEVIYDNSSHSHYLHMYITAEKGYAFPRDTDSIRIMVNGNEIGLYSYTVATPAANKLELRITFDSNLRRKVSFVDDVFGAAPPAQYVANGDCAVRPEDPIAYGHTFCGWYTDPACTDIYDFSEPVTADIILYAKWMEGSFMKGDFNGNGKIEVDDALAALRIAAKLAEATGDDLVIGDIDGNGKVEVDDALAILRVAAKLAPPESL